MYVRNANQELQVGAALLLLTALSCGGRAGDESPPVLLVDGASVEVKDRTSSVPFLQHLLRIESDADSIEVSGAKSEPIDVESERGVAVDAPLRVGQNELTVRLVRGAEARSFQLNVRRKDFEQITYVKPDEPQGLFGAGLGASGSRFCAIANGNDGRNVFVYRRGEDGWTLEDTLFVPTSEGIVNTCSVHGNRLALVHPGVRIFRRDEDLGKWVQEADLVQEDGLTYVAWGTQYFFVSQADQERILVFDIAQWKLETSLLAPTQDDAAFGNQISAFGDVLLTGATTTSDAGALYHVHRMDGEWLVDPLPTAVDGGDELNSSWFTLASATRAYAQTLGETRGLARLDLENGTWVARQAIRERSDGAPFQGIGRLMAHGDLLFFGARDSDAGTGINPPFEGHSYLSNAVYAFEDVDGEFRQVAYLKSLYHPKGSLAPDNDDFGELFGEPIALGDNFLVAGALGDLSGNTGIGADPEDESSPGSGAVWIFE